MAAADQPQNDAKEDDIQDHEYPSGVRLAAIVFALVLGIFLASLDTTIITTAIPSITNDFHSLQDVGWYASALFFSVAATQSMWGKAYKYFPVKPVFLFSIFVFEVGSLICALAPNSNAFIAGRAITGVGIAGTFAGCFIIIALSARPRLRPAMTSSLSATFALAAVVGPLVGGAFTQNVTWRWCFYINLPLGGCAALALWLAFHPPKAAAPTPATPKEKLLQMDIPGVILICATVVCFTLATKWAGVEKAWSSGTTVGLLVASFVLLLLFSADQWHQGDRALLVPSFFKNRALLVGAVFEFFISGCFNLPVFYLPIYFQATRGASAISSGVRLIPVILSLTFAQIFIGGIITKTGIFNPFLLICPALAAVGSGLLMLLHESSSTGEWIGYQIVLGVGVGVMAVPLMLAQVVVGPKDVPTATAITIFAQSMGSAVFIPVAQAVFQNTLLKSLKSTLPHVNAYQVLAAGANNEAISTFPADAIPGILASYIRALKMTFAVGVPLAGVSLLVAVGMPWFRYHNETGKKEEGGEEGAAEAEAKNEEGVGVVANGNTDVEKEEKSVAVNSMASEEKEEQKGSEMGDSTVLGRKSGDTRV
ncbi:MFS general substrate transporter [Lentithecium fluviatile CBS 122367]|uniref:MFS general substrate transporter n=1 Tax=Lentithecium fluviatile CBS 122367 TaxID=1168545 RepID=A0A6G1IKL4_9PLEO|nr:MFS general substrate transporter [Lentithecium fluviatile CBS 122367]